MEKTVNNFRYERKFLVNETRYENIEALVKIHPIQFREIYQPRFVNNIYLDTFNLDFYYDNIIGTADRKKFESDGIIIYLEKLNTQYLNIKLKWD